MTGWKRYFYSLIGRQYDPVVTPTEETKRSRAELLKQVKRSKLRLRKVEPTPDVLLHSEPCLTWVQKKREQSPPPPPPSPNHVTVTIIKKSKQKKKRKQKNPSSTL